MPFLTLPLAPHGPQVDVTIGPSKPMREAMAKSGVPVPQPVPARLLIDTGASCTCIDPSILNMLALTPRGKVPIHTPSTQGTAHPANQYDVMLSIPMGTSGLSYQFFALPVIESSLANQGIQGLLGRDVLEKALFTYNGTAKIFLLCF